jgi:sporulation protein YlmC with PRC-barrel domain
VTRQPDPLRIDFHLLDRQIVDRDGRLVGNVDDVEFADGADGPPRVTAILVGMIPLGDRIGGRVGRWMAALGRRLSMPDHEPIRIPYHLVDTVGSEVTLLIPADQLPEPGLERWLRQHLIERIPGAGHVDQ